MVQQPSQIAYLGPPGTYSHLVAEKRFGKHAVLSPQDSILGVCAFVARNRDAMGVVPIENSSGGAIYEMVDILLANKPRVHIVEERALHVNLALLGRKGVKIRRLFSHFIPLEHSDDWIKKHLPRVQTVQVASTGMAARQAFLDNDAAALGGRNLARIYNLDILDFPVEGDIPNITTFLIISGRRQQLDTRHKTTLAAITANKPGSLCELLTIFKNEEVNLSRLISRPLRGCHREYMFLVDIEGGTDRPNVRRALAQARRQLAHLRVVGSYPCGRPYRS